MKYSEYIHKKYQLDNFKLTGDPVKDSERYVEYMEIPSRNEKYKNIIKNTALYRFSFGETFTVHTLTDGVVGKIAHTRIENIPKEIPVFMQSSFLIEARHDKNLFDNVQSIGGLIINNEIYLIFMTDDEKLHSQTFSKYFDGIKIDDVNMMYNYDKNNDPLDTIYMKERKDILSFVLVFSLMMEAERTPFTVEVKNNKKQNANKSRLKGKTDWIEKRIYIDKNIKYINRNKKADYRVLDKDGKHLKDTSVHGFLRLQHFGKELSESKWIYIDDYDSKRWVNKGDTRILVDTYDK